MTAVADAARALMILLPESDSRLPAKVAIESLRRQGFTDAKTLGRARADAGVISERTGFGPGGSWWWSRVPMTAKLRGRRRHAQSVRPRSWKLDDRRGDVATSCDVCRHIGQAAIEALPWNCPDAGCPGILRKPAAAEPVMPEPVPDGMPMRSNIDEAVWPGMAAACPVCGRGQLVAPTGRCVYRPVGCRGLFRVHRRLRVNA